MTKDSPDSLRPTERRALWAQLLSIADVGND